MTTVLLRLFLVYNLFHSIVSYLVPKTLRAFLPASWYQRSHPDKDPSPPPRTDADELRSVFQMFDRNGDERITKTELNDSLENMGIFIPDRELSQMIDRIDVNGDGCVDMDEFGALYRNIMDERSVEEDMREAFDVFDRNGDGFISADELESVLASLGLKQGRAAEDCKMMIMRVDADGDGTVNFTEFKQMMRGGAFAALGN